MNPLCEEESGGGVPIYQYKTDPHTPPVSVVRTTGEDMLERGRHIHDFPALWYVPSACVVYVAAAGEVLDPGQLEHSDDGVVLFFDPAALGDGRDSSRPLWRGHPLLFPFLHGEAGGMLGLELPVARRAAWDAAIAAIEAELTDRRDGYRQAALAHLTLLLIDLARLAVDVVGDLQHSGHADNAIGIQRRAVMLTHGHH